MRIQAKINDFEKFKELHLPAELNIKKIDKGSFTFSMDSYKLNSINILNLHSNSFLLQEGVLDNVFGFYFTKDFDLIKLHKGEEVQQDTIIVQQPKNEIMANSKLSLYAMMITEDFLFNLLKELDLEELMQTFNNTHLLHISSAMYKKFLNTLNSFFILLNSNENPTKDSLLRYKAEVELPSLLINAFLYGKIITKKINTNFNDFAFKKALRLINESYCKHISVASLSEKIEVSERTLRNMFNSKMGIAPSIYIKAYKMHCIHERLINAESNAQIKQIAKEFGINHMGQFAQSYYEFSGQLPSYNLSKKTK